MKWVAHALAGCCLLVAPAAFADGVQVDVRVNRLQGLLDLAYSYCGGPLESVALQHALESVGHRSGEAPEAIVRFCMTDIHRAFAQPVERSPIYGAYVPSLWDDAIHAAVTSADMSAFVEATSDRLTQQEQEVVVAAMEEMAPLYERLIQAPYGEPARERGEALSGFLQKHRFGSLLRKIEVLYSVQRPREAALWIGLSPIPPRSAGFSATPHGDVIRGFMPVDWQRMDVYAGILAHEYAHMLFSGLTAEAAGHIQSAFASTDSSSRRFAEVWMNEALATAAGNGWLKWKMSGELDPGEWYADPVVDAYAKAISPGVHAALESGRGLDAHMIAAFVAAFDQALPDARDDPAVVLPHASLIADLDPASLSALGDIYRSRVDTRVLSLEFAEASRYVSEQSLPTIVRVAVDGSAASATEWKRHVYDDGGFEYSVRIQSVDAFDQSLADLIVRIRAGEW